LAAQSCLNAALELKKDPELVLKWSAIISDIADRLAHSPKPGDQNQTAAWETRIGDARMVEIYSESVLYEAAQRAKDPYKVIELGEALAVQNADSEYALPMAELLFKAYLETGDTDKALALAKGTLERSPDDVQMLLDLASLYKSKKQPQQALALAQQAVDLTNTNMLPDGMSDAQWEPRKIALRAFGEYLEGVIYATTGKWSDADAKLRASLSGIQRPQSKAEALYYLGLANYRLAENGDGGRASDALLFSRQSADIPSSFQQLARQNAEAIRLKFQLQ
jgi:tetratricopeptide (TPR) repeat protein